TRLSGSTTWAIGASNMVRFVPIFFCLFRRVTRAHQIKTADNSPPLKIGLMAVGFDRYGDRARLHEDPIKHLYEVYVRINKDIAENPGLDKKANEYFKQMEEGEPTVLNLWQ